MHKLYGKETFTYTYANTFHKCITEFISTCVLGNILYLAELHQRYLPMLTNSWEFFFKKPTANPFNPSRAGWNIICTQPVINEDITCSAAKNKQCLLKDLGFLFWQLKPRHALIIWLSNQKKEEKKEKREKLKHWAWLMDEEIRKA